MHLYRIYTENKNYAATTKLVRSYFPDGFTVYKAEGHWSGGVEHSMVIEIATNDEQRVYDLAWDIRKENGQDSVLVVATVCEVKWVR